MVVNTGRYDIGVRRGGDGGRISSFAVASTSMQRAEVASFESPVPPEA